MGVEIRSLFRGGPSSVPELIIGVIVDIAVAKIIARTMVFVSFVFDMIYSRLFIGDQTLQSRHLKACRVLLFLMCVMMEFFLR